MDRFSSPELSVAVVGSSGRSVALLGGKDGREDIAEGASPSGEVVSTSWQS